MSLVRSADSIREPRHYQCESAVVTRQVNRAATRSTQAILNVLNE